MRLGSVLAFAAGFVGAAVVVGLAAKSRLGPRGEAAQRRLAADGAALEAEMLAYAAREKARLRVESKREGRAFAFAYIDAIGLTQIKTDLQRLQIAVDARRRTAEQLIDEWNPFNLLR